MICSLCKFKNIVLYQPRAIKECLEKGSTCPESSAWFIMVLTSGAVPGVWTGSPSVLRASHRRPASKTWTTARCSWDPSTWWWIEPLKRRFSHHLSAAVCFRLSPLPPSQYLDCMLQCFDLLVVDDILQVCTLYHDHLETQKTFTHLQVSGM